MKFASAALTAHLAQGQTTVTTVMIITRVDGTVIGLTELDADITVNGVLCHSYPGYSRLNLQNKQNLDTTSVQVDSIIDGTVITRDDIIAQRYDYAAVQVILVNWASIDAGMVLLTGSFATVTVNEYGWSVELRGMSYQTTFVGGELCSPTCRVDLGSPRCGIDLTPLTQTGTVSSTDGFKNLTVSGIAIGTAANSLVYSGGLLTWLTGQNAGLSTEVNQINGAGTMTLELDALLEINAGDTFSLSPGCDKTFATCVTIFENGINFQGEPDVPGDDHLLDYPDYIPPHT